MDLIIGAGITGLAYANMKTDNDYLIVDRDKEIGGYCKTIKKDGFTWDYSGHFFHFRDKQIEAYLIENIDSDSILKVTKESQIRYKNSYIDFPFQKNIHQLEKEEFIDCLYDLFSERPTDYESFKQMLYAKFGKSIAEKFLIPYNEKLYACDLDTLDTNAMGRFFPYANKEEIVLNFKQGNNSSYNSHFTYPRGGAIEYVNSLYKRLDPQKISLDENITSIDYKNKKITTPKREVSYDRLISSMPFPRLLDALGMDYDKSVFTWNKVLVFNLGFNKKGNDTKNHWVYFPEGKYTFYRIGYYDNIFSDNRMSLYVELGFNKDEEINVDLYLEKTLADLKKAGIITDHDLVSYHSVIMDPAYVHINKRSDEEVRKIKAELEKQGIFSIGRYGSWTYCSIEDNIIEARELANKLLSK